MIGKRTAELVFTALLLVASVLGIVLVLRSGQQSARTVKLHSWAMEGDTARIRSHLEAGADVETRSSSGRTLLMSAASQGRVEVVRLLLAHGAKVDAADDQGRTALMHAAAAPPALRGAGLDATVRVLKEAEAGAR